VRVRDRKYWRGLYHQLVGESWYHWYGLYHFLIISESWPKAPCATSQGQWWKELYRFIVGVVVLMTGSAFEFLGLIALLTLPLAPAAERWMGLWITACCLILGVSLICVSTWGNAGRSPFRSAILFALFVSEMNSWGICLLSLVATVLGYSTTWWKGLWEVASPFILGTLLLLVSPRILKNWVTAGKIDMPG